MARLDFDRNEKKRLFLLATAVVGLHVLGFGLFLYYNAQPGLHDLSNSQGLIYAGAASLAYGLGLRHAFDADHIAAIDDTTRFLLQKGQKPLAVGFFFSLGHSTIVMGLSVAIAIAAAAAASFEQGFHGIGGVIGTLVSGTFLYVIAALNLVVLVGIYRVWRAAKRGTYRPDQLNELLANRGLLNRMFRGRFDKILRASWQMYPLGLLFGLGFDTATEVGLLSLSATAAAGSAPFPPLAIVALPILFTAGMSLMDTLDGVFMSKAYGWAFVTPIRKIYYNLTTTGLSIFVAFVIGTIELVSLLSDKVAWTGEPWRFIQNIDINRAGQIVVASFVIIWIVAFVLYRVRRIDERYGDLGSARTR